MIHTKIHQIRDNGWIILRCKEYPNQDVSIHSDKVHANPKIGDEVVVESIKKNDRGFLNAFMPRTTKSERGSYSPKDTTNQSSILVRFKPKVINLSNREMSNFALFINKPEGFLFTENVQLKKYSIRDKSKQEDKDLSRNVGEVINNFRFNAQQIKSINTRQASYVATVCQTSDNIKTGLHANSRLAIGLGTASVYETGMLLHAVYGFPYIPASSVKGVVRSYIISEVFENDEVEALKDKTFCDIFGCSGEGKIEIANFKSHYKIAAEKTKAKDNGDRQGKIVFFEAFPTDSVKVKIDVMTPHYGDYYGDNNAKTPPADYLSPNPITFLTVEGTKFTFHFGLLLGEENILVRFKDKDVGNKEEKQPILSLVNHWLTQALTQHGIGAKTAVGYGYMQK